MEVVGWKKHLFSKGDSATQFCNKGLLNKDWSRQRNRPMGQTREFKNRSVHTWIPNVTDLWERIDFSIMVLGQVGRIRSLLYTNK